SLDSLVEAAPQAVLVQADPHQRLDDGCHQQTAHPEVLAETCDHRVLGQVLRPFANERYSLLLVPATALLDSVAHARSPSSKALFQNTVTSGRVPNEPPVRFTFI